MVSMPTVKPVTTPPITEACVLTELHEPPPTGSDRVIDEPTQTPAGPAIVPVVSAAPIVMIADAVAVPQAFVI